MQLSLQTFQQLLQRMSVAVQSSASQLVDLSVGSVLRAVLEANASIGLWIQWLIVQTLSMTRAATSSGSDLDSWMADFSLTRQPATAARGIATFSRLLTGTTTNIPAGTQVKTSSGNLAFEVAVDTRNAAWQAASGSYVLPLGVTAIDLPITATLPGSSGNVSAGVITAVATAVPGLDSVSNASALSGGFDAETDAKFRTRFRDYINSRSLATVTAIGYSIIALQQSLRYRLFENTDSTGAWSPGQFLIIVDDGSGYPSASVLANVYAVVDKVRPIGSSFMVRAPNVVSVDVAISLTGGAESLDAAVTSLVIAAVSDYINGLPIGGTLSTTRIAEVAYRIGQFQANILSVAIDDTAADLAAPDTGLLRAQSVKIQ
jgi:uncharacterized phage protein gp47/JayE